MTARLGVCSWSLRPTSPEDLAGKVRAVGLSAVQLALDPVTGGTWDERRTIAALSTRGIRVLSGMMTTLGEDYSTPESIRATGGVRPDRTWPANKAAAERNAALAARLGLTLITLHAGFIPHEPSDPEWPVLIDRLRTLADIFHAHGLRLGLETGQEDPQTLLNALHAIDRPNVGVNFDPANMILYGTGEPIDALTRLAPFVLQLHVKDAVPSASPGDWGAEAPAGSGAVDWPGFFRIVRANLADRDLLIEREAGEEREQDVRTAAQLVGRNAAWVTGS